jgi:hypothetical protein
MKGEIMIKLYRDENRFNKNNKLIKMMMEIE